MGVWGKLGCIGSFLLLLTFCNFVIVIRGLQEPELVQDFLARYRMDPGGWELVLGLYGFSGLYYMICLYGLLTRTRWAFNACIGALALSLGPNCCVFPLTAYFIIELIQSKHRFQD
jgi:hypothetical protein